MRSHENIDQSLSSATAVQGVSKSLLEKYCAPNFLTMSMGHRTSYLKYTVINVKILKL